MNEQRAIFRGQAKTKALCFVAVVAVLIATLQPFDPFPRNCVTWLPETSGLRLERHGLVISNGPLRLTETGTGAYSLELLLRPASATSVSAILAFYEPTRAKQFMVRQWMDALVVMRDATVESDGSKTTRFGVHDVFRPARLILVTISSGPEGTVVYLDGRPARSVPGFKISPGGITGEIVVGTSPTKYDPWQGEVHGLAIYAKALTGGDAFRHYQQWTDPSGGTPDLEAAVARYTFTDRPRREVRNEVASEPALEIPATFSVPHKGFLESVPKEFKANWGWGYVIDVLTNIAGFVPLGMIVCAYFTWTRSRWKAILIATIACGLLSSTIEVLQYYIPQRGSGMTDILTNTLGAGIGSLLTQAAPFSWMLRRLGLIRTVQQPTEK